MQFQSAQFFFFFAAVLIISTAANRYQRSPVPRNLVLLFASYLFYAAWKPVYLLLILFFTVSNYVTGTDIERAAIRSRKIILGCSIFINLGLLFYFKYAGFAVETFFRVTSWTGLAHETRALHIILPIAISFITFEAISYNVDVYRKTIRAESNFLCFALYFAFFPRLVSGPIVRPFQILPHLHKTRNRIHLRSGISLILRGLFKKVCVSDLISYVPDLVFKSPDKYSAQEIWLAVFAFTVQIYCDFSGYTDIAIGAARMLGIRLPQNFNMPYQATSIRDFWQRWHITLSTWLRDYLYIPLGGNRGGNVYRNLFLTMLLGGLWHGASWSFVIWGGIHGGVLVAYHIVMRFKPDFPMPRIPAWLLTQFIVVIGWIFFRADSAQTAFNMIGAMLDVTRYSGLTNKDWTMVLYTVILFYMIHLGAGWIHGFRKTIYRYGRYFVGVYQALLIVAILFTIKPDEAPFIYFQF